MNSQKYRVRNFSFATRREKWVVHPLQRGDNLYRLAEKYGTSVLQIIRDNPTIDPRQLALGQVLLLRMDKE